VIVGVVVLKYGFDLVDRSDFTLLGGSILFAGLQFLCIFCAYTKADSTKRLYDEMDRKRDRKEV
jgi:hypothetical protein